MAEQCHVLFLERFVVFLMLYAGIALSQILYNNPRIAQSRCVNASDDKREAELAVVRVILFEWARHASL